MIIIKHAESLKGKKQYHVVHTGKNNEPLNNTENVSSKQNCWINILADTENFEGCTGVWVKDKTVKDQSAFFRTIEVLKKKASKK